jgi:predicted GTPase
VQLVGYARYDRGVNREYSDETKSSLVDAVAAATAAGALALDELELESKALIRDLGESLTAPELTAHLDAYVRDSHLLLDRQREQLSTFNIAFFGRTGTGKSTLLSAFGQLDGSGVSPGFSDFTTDVIPIDWNGCRLWDTPGINGWGRTRRRADLEDAARKAVESADVVLLCFDTQSQQASEFTKVAQWVQAFGKPAIAVLNVRNRRWRHSAKVTRISERERHSRSVREHANNIRTELAHIGLGGAAVVAINTQRALFARATTPFHGQSAKDFDANRSEFGVAYLHDASNFEVLEDLLAASITSGGTELRLTSLYAGMRALRERLATQIINERNKSATAIELGDRSLTTLLRVLGYPDGPDRKALLGDSEPAFSQLEQIRGEFTEASEGSLARHSRGIITVALGAVRTDSHLRAEKVTEKILNGAKLSSQQVRDAIFDEADIDAAEELVWKSYEAFLQRQLDLVPGVHTKTGAEQQPTVSAQAVGRFSYRAARAVQVAAKGAGAAGAVLGFNPVGWGILAVGAAGGKLLLHTQGQQALTRAAAFRDARDAVNGYFDELDSRLREAVLRHSWVTAGPVLSKHVEETLRHQRVHSQSLTAEGLVKGIAPGRSNGPTAGDVLARATSAVENTRTFSRDAEVWLGEDWLLTGQPRNHIDPSTSLAVSQFDYGAGESVVFLEEAWAPVDQTAVDLWLKRCAQFIQGSEDGCAIASPRVVILGDYNAGKSTLIRRLLFEAGEHIDHEIEIRASATTSGAREYQVGRYRLIDTPGLQSGSSAHDLDARESLTGASLVVVVLQVNLLIGDAELIRTLIDGGRNSPSRRSRTLFVINRADELGVDPVAAPADFVNLREQKAAELISTLASQGVEIDRGQIHIVAADPYGIVGGDRTATRESFGAHREWDGVQALIDMFTSATDTQVSTGTLLGQADTTMSSLLAYHDQLTADIDALSGESTRRTEDLSAVVNGLGDLRVLLGEARENLRRAINQGADVARQEIKNLGTIDRTKLTNAVDSWHQDPSFRQRIADVTSRAADDLTLWADTQTSVIGRRSALAQWTAGVQTTVTAPSAQSAAFANAPKVVGDAGKYAAKAAKHLGQHKNVYDAGKKLGVKFKPWGAVKASKRFAKAGPVLIAVGAVADGVAMFQDHLAHKAWAKEESAALRLIDRQAQEIEDSMITGSSGLIDSIAPVAKLLCELREHLDVLNEATGVQIDTMRDRLDSVSERIADAPHVHHE